MATVAHALMSATLTQVGGLPAGCGYAGMPCPVAAVCQPGRQACRPCGPHPAPRCAQAWFPAHAEVWNAPTWFLSALTFAMVVLPHALPGIAAMRRAGLRMLLGVLTAVSLLGKLAYSYDLSAWTLLEGVTSARAHPNLMFWNLTRFHPFYALVEVLVGVAAVRLVMVEQVGGGQTSGRDVKGRRVEHGMREARQWCAAAPASVQSVPPHPLTPPTPPPIYRLQVDDEGKPLAGEPKPAGSALLPALGLLGITLARAAGYLPLNDPLTRGLLFVPLFTLLLMRLHRQTIQGSKGLAGFLSHPILT